MSDAQQPTVSQTHDDNKADETEPDVQAEAVAKLENLEIKDSEPAHQPSDSQTHNEVVEIKDSEPAHQPTDSQTHNDVVEIKDSEAAQTHDDDKAVKTEPDVHIEPVVKLDKEEIKESEAAQAHDDDKADETEPDVHFEPVVKLEKVEIKDSEADETPIFKMRAKLFRFDKAATEWKERGTGEMKLLMHKDTGKVRVLMRREKTLKLCANHYITPEMKLNPNVGSDRSWVWTALADYSEEEVKPEMLAARFANSDLAQRFKAKFEEAQKWNQDLVSGAATPNSDNAPKPDLQDS